MKLSPQKLEGWGYRMVKISWSYLQPFWDVGSLNAENRQFCLQWPWNPGQGSPKVIDFGTSGKRVYTFLLVINSNFSPILHRFGDTCDINATIHGWKVLLMANNSVTDNTAYLHSFSCYCLRNTRNVAKFSENLTLQQFKVQGHRSWCRWKAHYVTSY